MKLPKMVAAVLDDETANFLKGLAVHQNVFCHHVTMAYQPSPEVYAKYQHLIGTTIEFDCRWSVRDHKGQATFVDGVPSEKKVPHITISCADGVEPVYSNQLFNNPQRRYTTLRFRGKATVRAW